MSDPQTPETETKPGSAPSELPVLPPHAIDWHTQRLWQIQPVRDVLLLVLGLGLLYLGYVLSAVTVPLLLALLLAYLFEPVVSWITRLGARPGESRGWIGRPMAAIVIIFVLVVGIVLPLMVALGYGVLQGAGFANQQAINVRALWRSVQSPEDARLQAALPSAGWVRTRDWLVELKEDADAMREQMEGKARAKPEGGPASGPAAGPGQQGAAPLPVGPPAPGTETAATAAPAGGGEGSTEAPAERRRVNPVAVQVFRLAEWAAQYAEDNAGTLSRRVVDTGAEVFSVAWSWAVRAGFLIFGGFLTLFFFFFISVSFVRVVVFLRGLVPPAARERTEDMVRKMDAVIAAFVRGRLIIAGFFMIYFTLCYWVIAVPVPLALGPVVGLLCIVPYAATLGMFAAIGLGYLQPGFFEFQSTPWWIIGAPIVVHSLQQVLDDYVLTPRIQGKSTGMDTPTILFASLAGGVLAGFYGLLIAIPVAACLKIVVKELVAPRFRAWQTGEILDPLPVGKPSPPPEVR